MPRLSCRVACCIIYSVVLLCVLNTGVNAVQQEDAKKDVVEGSAVETTVGEHSKATISTQTGIASWYGSSFINRRTASGERYRPEDRTAAHRTLAFGTYVRVTNLSNKKSAIVRINNRGPYRKGRIIDLSRQAALDLGLVKTGIARVSVEVLTNEVAIAELAVLETSS